MRTITGEVQFMNNQQKNLENCTKRKIQNGKRTKPTE